MDDSSPKFNFLYSPITSENLALKVIRESTIFFIVISCLQIIFSVVNAIIYASLAAGIIIIILAALLYKTRNRAVALIFIFLTISELILVIIVFPQQLGIVGFIKAMAIIISIRSFQATNYLKKYGASLKSTA